MRAASRYLAWFGGTVLVLGMLAVGLTVVVDPYYRFGAPAVAGFNVVKPGAQARAAAAKTELVDRAGARTLLLGNSRVEVGFDPLSSAWPIAMRPVFNAGLSGYDLVIAAAMLDHAAASPTLRHVLVGVDLFDLTAPEDVATPGVAVHEPDQDLMRPAPGAPDNPARRMARLRDLLTATLTLDAVTDSLATVLSQRRAGVPTITPLGFGPAEDQRFYAAEHGFRDLFVRKLAQYQERLDRARHPDFADPERSRDLRALRQIVRTAAAHDLELTVMIYPYHAWVMDAVRRAGLEGTMADLRRAVPAFVASLDPAGRVRVVDFSEPTPFTTEPVPPAGDVRSAMRWYWDPGHFQPALGDVIVERLYGGGHSDFGRTLAPVR